MMSGSSGLWLVLFPLLFGLLIGFGLGFAAARGWFKGPRR